MVASAPARTSGELCSGRFSYPTAGRIAEATTHRRGGASTAWPQHGESVAPDPGTQLPGAQGGDHPLRWGIPALSSGGSFFSRRLGWPCRVPRRPHRGKGGGADGASWFSPTRTEPRRGGGIRSGDRAVRSWADPSCQSPRRGVSAVRALVGGAAVAAYHRDAPGWRGVGGLGQREELAGAFQPREADHLAEVGTPAPPQEGPAPPGRSPVPGARVVRVTAHRPHPAPCRVPISAGR
jgi:hypothetical protein